MDGGAVEFDLEGSATATKIWFVCIKAHEAQAAKLTWQLHALQKDEL